VTALSTIPAYAPRGRKVSVIFTLTESGSNFVRVWCTAAPLGSALRQKLDGDADPLNRVQVHQGQGGENHPWRETFDVGELSVEVLEVERRRITKVRVRRRTQVAQDES
jgi:hypothetical protein